MRAKFVIIFVIVACVFAAGCSGGGTTGPLEVGTIQGSATINEDTASQYSIDASGDSGITYLWACSPSSVGTFSDTAIYNPTFTPATVHMDTQITIQVTVNSDNYGPEVVTLNVTVTNLPVSLGSGWVRGWGSAQNESCHAVAVDGSGNAYVGGYFRETIDFDPGTGTDSHTVVGGTDAFLSKFDTDGNHLWTETWGGSLFEICGGVAVDEVGDVYVTGSFQDTVDFGVGSPVTSLGDDDAFLAKFDTNGDIQWVQVWGDTEADGGEDVFTDSGDLYVIGVFSSLQIDLDPGSTEDTHDINGSTDSFLSKFDTDGNFDWAVNWGSEVASNYTNPADVIADSSGNIYIAGDFGNDVDFDPSSSSTIITSSGLRNAYLLALDDSGDFLWVNTWGGTGAMDQTVSRGITFDTSGDLCVSGQFTGTCDFGPGYSLASAGSFDAFLTKIDTSGTHVIAYSWGGTDYDAANGIATDGSGNIYVTGFYSGANADLDPDPVDAELRSSVGDDEVFIIKLDDTDDFLWAYNTEGTGAGDYPSAYEIAADSAGQVFVAGIYKQTVDFDPDVTVDAPTWVGIADCYILKVLPDGTW